jgi:ribosomal protein L18
MLIKTSKNIKTRIRHQLSRLEVFWSDEKTKCQTIHSKNGCTNDKEISSMRVSEMMLKN